MKLMNLLWKHALLWTACYSHSIATAKFLCMVTAKFIPSVLLSATYTVYVYWSLFSVKMCLLFRLSLAQSPRNKGISWSFRFRDDVAYMTGVKPGLYWVVTWRYIGPVLGLLLFIAGLYDMGVDGIGYNAWNKETVGHFGGNAKNKVFRSCI